MNPPPALNIAIKKVLIGCSLSPSAAAVVAESQRIAQILGAEPFFCHVGKETASLRTKLGEILKKAGVPSGSEKLVIKPGQPDKVMCTVAAEVKADMIIIGALKHEGTWVGILGSVARRIVRYAPCSVLLLTKTHSQDKPFSNIVVRVQYDSPTRRALHFILDYVQKQGIKGFHVVHEYDPYWTHLGREAMGDERRIRAHAANSKKIELQTLADFISEFTAKGISITKACLEGQEGYEVTQYALKHRSDLLVTPMPKRMTSIWDRFFNTPSEVTLQDLPCSALFLKSTK